MTIKKSLRSATKILNNRKIKSSSFDAELLLLHALNLSKNKPKTFYNDRAWLYAHSDHKSNKAQKNRFSGLVKRREKFEPIAYITGEKEFFGLNFFVDKNVLIPRPETEIMVENALKDITWKLSFQVEAELPSKHLATDNKIVIADIGTGSGAIAVSIAKTLKNQKKLENTIIYATDISPKALKIAKINAKIYNCNKNIIFKKGNLLKALPKNTKIDYLLANLPYVRNDYYYKWLKNGSAPSEFYEIKHEPKSSLLAKNNGMEYFEKFFPTLPKYITNKTKIFMESDPYQIKAIKNLAKKYLPTHKIEIFKDLQGLNRITKIEIVL